jgi:hypothetical protein
MTILCFSFELCRGSQPEVSAGEDARTTAGEDAGGTVLFG